ncbi:YopX family protein [Frisingicoccus sp.]|uniref:YopX family protein n=1 Tax=Frisingicoccus sp. TaxID=1918627 RepID=UPI002E7A21CF|nr:YopX family protein [Frisingicoccus sp.]MEE0751192.1 YopX family protein [Frisingicoccus sp.]
MGEILFKAKRIDNGEWVEGCLFDGAKFCVIGNVIKFSPYIKHEQKIVGFIVDKETLCQYTGLTDRNDQKIWENDICIIENGTTFDDEDGYFEVGFDEDSARFILDGDGLTVDFDYIYSNDTEVVGNIFDNPELL